MDIINRSGRIAGKYNFLASILSHYPLQQQTECQQLEKGTNITGRSCIATHTIRQCGIVPKEKIRQYSTLLTPPSVHQCANEQCVRTGKQRYQTLNSANTKNV